MRVFAGLSPPYRTIVADPPWPYDNANDSRPMFKTAEEVIAGQRGVNGIGYSTMSIEDLSALPVGAIAADDAHLYLWVTNAFIVEGYQIARAWGFAPKTVLTWTKTHQDDPTRVSMKTGYYFRGATEHALFCVRGSLPLQTSEGLPTGYLRPRIGAHSVKPDAFMDLVEQASPGPYLELFARQPRLGWDSWGKGYEQAVTA